MDHCCSSNKVTQMTDTVKIPRATIQYTNQDPQHNRRDNLDKMSRHHLIKSKTIDTSDENNFEKFFNDLRQNETSPRHSTISGSRTLTAANLARLNQRKLDQTFVSIPSKNRNRDFTITVDSMATSDNYKTNETDSISIASSTYFTMINGFGASRIRQQERPVCCCNHITAVIVTMTILLMFIIFGIIMFAEYPRMMAEIEK